MSEQNYNSHRKFVKGYHIIGYLLLTILLVLSVYSVYISYTDNNNLRYSIMFLTISVLMIMAFYYLRAFSLKAQDRAIKAEESLRYYIRKGKVLNPELKISQIIALRFASDEEYDELTLKVIKENLSSDQIKKEIKKWRADNYRV